VRICSLLPSTTEIVCALGMSASLVGKTHECDYPPEVNHVPVVTKSLIDHSESTSSEIDRHISEAMHRGSGIYAIDDLVLGKINPDLILTQELCEVCAVSYSQVETSVRKLEADIDVISLEPTTLGGILETIVEIGDATGSPLKARELSNSLQKRIDHVREMTSSSSFNPKVLSLEWLDPPFCGGHWIPEMIGYSGGVDAVSLNGSPSKEIKWEEAVTASPDLVILMVCGFDLEKTATEFLRLANDQSWGAEFWGNFKGDTYVVDGSSYFSRPGPRIVDGLEILAEIIQPKIFPRTRSKSEWTKIL